MTPRFSLDEFRRVDPSPATVLIRLAGTWTAEEPVRFGTVELEVVSAGVGRRFRPLPDPGQGLPAAGSGGRAWRGAFPLPARVADAAEQLVLHTAGAPDVPIRTPSQRAEERLAAEVQARQAAEADARAQRSALTAAEHDLMQQQAALDAVERALAAIERERDEAVAAAGAARAEAAAALAEQRVVIQTLERARQDTETAAHEAAELAAREREDAVTAVVAAAQAQAAEQVAVIEAAVAALDVSVREGEAALELAFAERDAAVEAGQASTVELEHARVAEQAFEKSLANDAELRRGLEQRLDAEREARGALEVALHEAHARVAEAERASAEAQEAAEAARAEAEAAHADTEAVRAEAEAVRAEAEAAREAGEQAVAAVQAEATCAAQAAADEAQQLHEHELEAVHDQQLDAERELRAAAERAAGLEGRLEALEREHSRSAAGPSTTDGAETVALERRIAQLENEIELGNQRIEDLTTRLSDAERQTEQAIARAREEAEARDRAEARTADGDGRRRRRTDAPPDTPTDGGEAPDGASLAQVAGLEAELEAARANADQLAGDLLATRHDLVHAADRVKDETEARMRAESRAAAADR